MRDTRDKIHVDMGGGKGQSFAGNIAFFNQTSVPQTSSSTLFITTPTMLSVPVGSAAALYARNGGGNVQTTFSSSPAGTPLTPLAIQTNGNIGSAQLGFIIGLPGGSTTFTATLASSQSFQSLIVVVFSASPVFTSLDGSGAGGNSTVSASSFTTPTFSTTSGGIIVQGVTTTTNLTYTVGAIGSGTGTNWGGTTTNDSSLQYLISATAQSNITATYSWSAAASFCSTVGALH